MTDNELIAEFMGYWYEKPEGLSFTYLNLIRDGGTEFERKDTLCTIGNERFDKSWDWLMPVVEKIETLGFKFTIHNDAALIERTHNRLFRQGQFMSAVEDTKLNAAYKAVVEFIKFYNGQN